MSGFTTTGASVVTDFDGINHSLGMWRQFTQWLGGMGIIVLAIAVLPRLRVGGRQLMESELPGPEIAQLAERIRSTARQLWFLYVALTVVQTLMLASLGLAGIDDRMTPFEALAHAFSTHADRRLLDPAALGSRRSPPQRSGSSRLHGDRRERTSRSCTARFVRRRPRVLVRDEEFRLYLGDPRVASVAARRRALGIRDRGGRGGDPRTASSRRSRS